MTGRHDVAIVGAGPAGIFAALELARLRPDLGLIILEQGPDLDARACPIHKRSQNCAQCSPCSITTGWGGAGAFSDGKLTLTTGFGGSLAEYMPEDEVQRLVDHVDGIYLEFGAPKEVHGQDSGALRDLARRAAGAELQLVPAVIRHLGTDRCMEILGELRRYLGRRAEIRTGARVERVEVGADGVAGVTLGDGSRLEARYVALMPGRAGAEWMAREAARLQLPLAANPVDIGVRVEVPADFLEPLTEVAYEAKLVYNTRAFDDQVRTFCMNPHGEVVVENYGGLLTVNGHAYAGRKTDRSNFALLVSKTFTEPFHEPITYGQHVARLANMLGGGVLVQRLGDLRAGRRTTEKRLAKGMVRPTLKDATPGDLSLVLPYRHLVDILEMLTALDKVAPGVNSSHTLLYGVEVKFYSSRLSLSQVLETRIPRLFAAGDGAGVTRGLVQASASGVVVAREIARREGQPCPQ